MIFTGAYLCNEYDLLIFHAYRWILILGVVPFSGIFKDKIVNIRDKHEKYSHKFILKIRNTNSEPQPSKILFFERNLLFLCGSTFQKNSTFKIFINEELMETPFFHLAKIITEGSKQQIFNI